MKPEFTHKLSKDKIGKKEHRPAHTLFFIQVYEWSIFKNTITEYDLFSEDTENKANVGLIEVGAYQSVCQPEQQVEEVVFVSEKPGSGVRQGGRSLTATS